MSSKPKNRPLGKRNKMTLKELIENLQKINQENPEISDKDVFINDDRFNLINIERLSIECVIDNEYTIDPDDFEDLDENDKQNSSEHLVINLWD